MNEAEMIVSDMLGCDRFALYSGGRQRLDKAVSGRLAAILRRRMQGEPLAYITGAQDFYGLSFSVTPDVLIPRQDTEILVEAALRLCRGMDCPRLLEIGTGSGAVAVSLAVHCAQAQVVATDISPAALTVAQQNVCGHAVQERVRLLRADLFPEPATGDSGLFDLIVSNPPYIPSGDIAGLEREVRSEPRVSLDGGFSGLDFYRRIAASAAGFLKPRGYLLFEIGCGQRQAVEEILAGTAKFSLERVIKDYNGIDRVIIAKELSSG